MKPWKTKLNCRIFCKHQRKERPALSSIPNTNIPQGQAEIKTFSDGEKLREFIASTCTVNEYLKKVLKTNDEKRKERTKESKKYV